VEGGVGCVGGTNPNGGDHWCIHKEEVGGAGLQKKDHLIASTPFIKRKHNLNPLRILVEKKETLRGKWDFDQGTGITTRRNSDCCKRSNFITNH